ncbi:MAG: hypothetical protein AAF721_25935 [Myxococcota bacterium]
MMDEIERYQQSLLSAARLNEAPSPDAFDRMRRGMLARIDRGDAGPPLPDIESQPVAEAQVSRRWIWWSVGAALAAAAVIALLAGPRAPSQVVAAAHDAAPMVGVDDDTSHAAEAKGPASRRATARRIVAPAPAEVDPPVPVEDEVTTPPPRPSRPRRSVPERPPKAEPASPATDVAGEAALMQAVQRALSADNLALAQQKLDRYRARFPNGVLAQEAAAVRTIIDCRLDAPNATQRATAYLKKHGTSPLAARVRRECDDG